MNPEPRPEHQWLQQLTGEWTYESEATAEPGQPPLQLIGTQDIRPIGDIWIESEMREETPSGPNLSLLTLGFDPGKERFVGTFLSSMMAELWHYEGQLDPAGRVLTLDTEGPAMTGDGRARYQDIIEVVDDRTYEFRSRLQDESGQWVDFMQMTCRRTA